MTAKKRITKHQMKEDRFVTSIFQIREWGELNLTYILIAFAAIVLVVFFIWFLFSQGAKKDIESYDLLGRAEIEIRNNQAQLAIIDLKKVVDDFGGSKAAALAAFKLGNVYFSQNDFENAEIAYKDYLDDYVIDDISRYSAMAGIAASLSAQGKYQEAGDKYLEVAELNSESAISENYLFSAVDSYIQANDNDGAKKAFSVLEKKGITSEKYRMAKILLIGSLAFCRKK